MLREAEGVDVKGERAVRVARTKGGDVIEKKTGEFFNRKLCHTQIPEKKKKERKEKEKKKKRKVKESEGNQRKNKKQRKEQEIYIKHNQ